MSTNHSEHWFLIADQPVEGLGHGELFQSSTSPFDFQATLDLNSYESNCLRNWLSQRWAAKSLEQTCIYQIDRSKLRVALLMSASNLSDAKERFGIWLQAVLTDQLNAAQSRA